MHSHDPDLIAALAEGTLDEETAAAAGAEVSTCGRCSADLQAQQTALSAISAAETPLLSPDEATLLKAAVAEAINISAVAAPQVRESRRVSWGALGIAAAALMGIIAVVPVLGLLQTGGDDAADLTVSAAEIDPDSDDTGERMQDGADLEAPATAGDVADETFSETTTEAASTTAAAVTTTTEPAAEALAALRPIEGEEGLDEILGSNGIAGYVDGERSSEIQCEAEALAELGPAAAQLAVPLLLTDGSTLLVFVNLDESRVAAFDAADCSLRLTRP